MTNDQAEALEGLRNYYEQQLYDIIALCAYHGFVPRIEITLCQPLSMGNIKMRGSVDLGHSYYRQEKK